MHEQPALLPTELSLHPPCIISLLILLLATVHKQDLGTFFRWPRSYSVIRSVGSYLRDNRLKFSPE